MDQEEEKEGRPTSKNVGSSPVAKERKRLFKLSSKRKSLHCAVATSYCKPLERGCQEDFLAKDVAVVNLFLVTKPGHSLGRKDTVTAMLEV